MDFHADFSLHWCTFFRMVYTNFHAKSWVCSSKNVWVISNSMVHGIFLAWIPCKFFFAWMPHLLGWSIWTSMRNLESVAQKMSELWHLVRKRTNIYISSIFKWLYSPNFISRLLEEKTQIYEFSHQLWVLRTCFYVIHKIEPRPLCIFLK